MATLAADTRTATKGAAKAPISTHPMFPAIVALWFAALLGLGSLILPTVLLERLVTVTGISSLVPMAAPPLGFTARATLALGMGTLGAALGMMLARRLAQGHEPKPRPRFLAGAEQVRRPISAHDELGQEGLGASAPQVAAQKRRTLAIAEESRRSEYLQHVPLPGQDEHEPLPAPDDDALELGAFADADVLPEEPEQDQDMTDGIDFRPSRDTRALGEERLDHAAPPSQPAVERPDSVDALPFAAPSLRRQQDVPAFMADPFDLDDEEPVEPVIARGAFGTPMAAIEAQPVEPDPVLQPQLAVVEPEPDLAAAIAAGVDDRPLDDLGLVQLAARLGASIERRRAMRASPAQSGARAPVFAASGEDFDAAAAEDAAQARASFFAPQASPEETMAPEAFGPGSHHEAATLDSLSLDEDQIDLDEDDFAASLSLPAHEGPVINEEDDDGDADYSSLLAMTNPFQKKPEFVRVDEPEFDDADDFEATVTFPSARGADGSVRPFDPPLSASAGRAAPADPAEAERDLREALATLQRMSGAA